MSNDTCKRPGCDNESRNRGDPEYDGEYKVSLYGAKFCSVRCELKYDHIKADAEDARRAEEEERNPRHHF